MKIKPICNEIDCRKKPCEKHCMYCKKEMIMIKGDWYSEKYLHYCVYICRAIEVKYPQIKGDRR